MELVLGHAVTVAGQMSIIAHLSRLDITRVHDVVWYSIIFEVPELCYYNRGERRQ